ncbi:Non-histone chromosomal protein 6 [Quaeritorhiza haematococci]|nr:Non-histone chromosomal protein 6 [Quaeritorhiza haematococci]
MPKETKTRSQKVSKKAGGKKKKDPNAPKKALSAFMIFSQENRKIVKEENPNASFGESSSSSIIGRFKSFWALGSRVALLLGGSNLRQGDRLAVGFMKCDLWVPRVFAEPFLSLSDSTTAGLLCEIGKLLGKRWGEIDDQEKAVYSAKAEKDKARYEQEMAEYRATKDDEEEEDEE